MTTRIAAPAGTIETGPYMTHAVRVDADGFAVALACKPTSPLPKSARPAAAHRGVVCNRCNGATRTGRTLGR